MKLTKWQALTRCVGIMKRLRRCNSRNVPHLLIVLILKQIKQELCKLTLSGEKATGCFKIIKSDNRLNNSLKYDYRTGQTASLIQMSLGIPSVSSTDAVR